MEGLEGFSLKVKEKLGWNEMDIHTERKNQLGILMQRYVVVRKKCVKISGWLMEEKKILAVSVD